MARSIELTQAGAIGVGSSRLRPRVLEANCKAFVLASSDGRSRRRQSDSQEAAQKLLGAEPQNPVPVVMGDHSEGGEPRFRMQHGHVGVVGLWSCGGSQEPGWAITASMCRSERKG